LRAGELDRDHTAAAVQLMPIASSTAWLRITPASRTRS
jgi:hypothetical protein